jgi:hypothetical protein
MQLRNHAVVAAGNRLPCIAMTRRATQLLAVLGKPKIGFGFDRSRVGNWERVWNVSGSDGGGGAKAWRSATLR